MDTLTDLRKIRDDLAAAAAQIELTIEKAKIQLRNNRRQAKQIDRLIEFMESEEKKNG